MESPESGVLDADTVDWMKCERKNMDDAVGKWIWPGRITEEYTPSNPEIPFRIFHFY